MADIKPEEKNAPAAQGFGETPKKPKRTRVASGKNGLPLGAGLNFITTEAYKLLRTNLLFSFADEKKCHVVGITSSLRGEGKTTTAINTAYMLAETGRHVLVIEGDMRLPSISNQLEISRTPGLSNLLVNQDSLGEVIRKSGLHNNLYLLPAGDIPPNPSELLGCDAMKRLLDALSSKFDFIIVDLPPITAVSDALVVSKLCDGMVLVVRRDYATRSALDESMAQLKIANARVLGFVFTHGELPGSGKYKKYSGYNYKYGSYENR